MIFKISSRIFRHLFTYPLIYSSMFVSYIVHISRIRIHPCKRLLLSTCTIPEMESDFDFRLHLPLDLINLFNTVLSFNKSFNYFLYICHLLALLFRRRQSETFVLLKYFYSRELERISFQANVVLI